MPESDARSVYIMLSMNAGFVGREAELGEGQAESEGTEGWWRGVGVGGERLSLIHI